MVTREKERWVERKKGKGKISKVKDDTDVQYEVQFFYSMLQWFKYLCCLFEMFFSHRSCLCACVYGGLTRSLSAADIPVCRNTG